MIKNRDIIVVGIQSWDILIGSNCKNIAIEFAKHNRVLYVNAPLDRMSIKRHKDKPLTLKRLEMLKTGAENLIEVGENIWNLYPSTILESINAIPWNGLFNYVNKINNKRYSAEIRKAITRLNFKDYIIFNDSDMFRSFFMKEMLEPKLYAYYTRDNLLAVDFFQRHGTRIEPALMAKSDMVFANSTYLAALAAKHNPKSYYVGQGCDLSIYDKKTIGSVPDDIKNIPSPIIGYTGALYSLRLDVDILVHIAREKPHWSIVLIGPEDDDFKNSDLHKLRNVYFLGNKKPEELPDYVNKFDVALNPQKLNEVTRGNYPRKIDEYLAMGKPTVATKTEAMSVFADFTYLASNSIEYVEFIEKALKENTPEMETEREIFARSHSWENSVKAIYEQMEKVLK